MGRSVAQQYLRAEAKSEFSATAVKLDDMRVLNAIKDITGRGNNAEVRRRKDGSLTVYEVEKRITVG